MNPHNLQTSVLALFVAMTATACGVPDHSSDDGRDESFLALMGTDGKADSLAVTEGSAEARAVLDVVNTLDFTALENEVGLERRVTARIIAHRDGNGGERGDDDPYDSLRELDDTPWTTMAMFRRVWSFAHENGYVDAVRNPVQCISDDDCGTGVCHVDHCYDRRVVPLDVEGRLAFDIGTDGEWWVRAHSGGATVREARGTDDLTDVETSTYPDADLDTWLAELPDGSLSAITRTATQVVPEFGPPITLPTFSHAVAAAYDADGELFVAAEARDASGVTAGIVIIRQGEEGWREELKEPFAGARASDERPTVALTRNANGEIQLWVDLDGASRRFDRNTDGSWRESMVIDMAAAGFGDAASDRDVQFVQATDGTVFIHRSTWQFARQHEVLRIDGKMLSSVVDLRTGARQIAPHPDGSFSVLYADGALGRVRNGAEARGDSTPLAFPGSTLFRSLGRDLYALRAGELVILTAR